MSRGRSQPGAGLATYPPIAAEDHIGEHVEHDRVNARDCQKAITTAGPRYMDSEPRPGPRFHRGGPGLHDTPPGTRPPAR